MNCPVYGTCKCVNLCKRHCVRKAMEDDGWVLVNGEFIPKPKESDGVVGEVSK